MIREKEKKENILNESGLGVESMKIFDSLFLKKIELSKYLKLDKIIPDGVKIIEILKKQNHHLSLVTLRRSSLNLFEELHFLNLDSFFVEILVNPGHLKGEDWYIKTQLVNNSDFFNINESVIIGDTEIDILTGTKLNILSIAVTYGLRNKDFLLINQPDFIIENISELPKIINNII